MNYYRFCYCEQSINYLWQVYEHHVEQQMQFQAAIMGVDITGMGKGMGSGSSSQPNLKNDLFKLESLNRMAQSAKAHAQKERVNGR